MTITEGGEKLRCISKKGADWDNSSCKESLKKDSDGNVIGVDCNCPINQDVTIVDDIKGLFSDSKAAEVFSAAGISALANFEYH